MLYSKYEDAMKKTKGRALPFGFLKWLSAIKKPTAIELGITVTSWDNTTKDYTHYQTIITYTISLGE